MCSQLLEPFPRQHFINGPISKEGVYFQEHIPSMHDPKMWEISKDGKLLTEDDSYFKSHNGSLQVNVL